MLTFRSSIVPIEVSVVRYERSSALNRLRAKAQAVQSVAGMGTSIAPSASTARASGSKT